MIYRRKGVANDDIVYDDEGQAVRGCDFVGEDNLVRWFSIESQQAMTGIGEHNSSFGFLTYDDKNLQFDTHARMA